LADWLTRSGWSAFVLWNLRHESNLPYWPLERVIETQRRRVRSIVKHAWDNVPFYREAMRQAGISPADVRTSEDLASLPLLTKEEVARDPGRFESAGDARQAITLHSSGTSGRGIRIRYDPRALFLALAHGQRNRLAMASVLGRTTGYREAEISRPASVSLTIREFYDEHAWNPRGTDLDRIRLSTEVPFEENLERLNQFRPDVLRGYGSYIGAFFRWIQARQAHFHRPRLVHYGADPLSAADRALIEEEYQIPVWSTYQASEALRIGFFCEKRREFHLCLDDVAVRVVDTRGRAVEPGGTGELVLSNLTNRATVLLNLRIGDMVTLGDKPCECGRSLPTIRSIDGRADDLVALPDGSEMHALGLIWRLQSVPGVIQVQLVQEALRRFHLRVIMDGAADSSQVGAALEARLRATLREELTVEVEPVEQIPPEPGGKVKAVVRRFRYAAEGERSV